MRPLTPLEAVALVGMFAALVVGVLATAGWTRRAAAQIAASAVVLAALTQLPLVVDPLFGGSGSRDLMMTVIVVGTLLGLGAHLFPRRRKPVLVLLVLLVGLTLLTQKAALSAVLTESPIIGEKLGVYLTAAVLFAALNYTCLKFFPESRTLGPTDLVLPAIWFALATSLFELIVRGVFYTLVGPYPLFVFDWIILFRADKYWMIPAMNLIDFGVPALLLSFAAWVLPGRISRRAAAIAMVFPAFVRIVSLPLRFVHGVAIIILTLGIAVRLTSRWSTDPERFNRRMRRTMLPMAVLLLLLAVAFQFREATSGQRSAATRPAPSSDRPNVLIITLDTVRVQNLGLYGYARETTPQLEHWSRRGVLFQHAMTTAPWTLPSHASLFTGRWPHEHKADFGRPLDHTLPTLAEELLEQGYDTAGFVSNTSLCGRQTGLARGFLHYDDLYSSFRAVYRGSLLSLLPTNYTPDLRRSAAEINALFFDWLDRPRHRPFFAFLNYFDAHDPYRVPDAAFDRFASMPARERLRIRQRWLIDELDRNNPAEVLLAVDTYDAAIAYLDHHVGRLLDELERRGILDDTVVIITNDHGEHFGEHGHYGHTTSVYRQLIDAPLIVLYPSGVPSGVQVSVPVSQVAIPSTVLDLLGLESQAPFRRQSLARLWQDDSPADAARSEPLLAELCRTEWQPDSASFDGPVRSMVADGMHYIHYSAQNKEELFDYFSDPLDRHDLTETDDGQRQLARLRKLFAHAFDPGVKQVVLREESQAP